MNSATAFEKLKWISLIEAPISELSEFILARDIFRISADAQTDEFARYLYARAMRCTMVREPNDFKNIYAQLNQASTLSPSFNSELRSLVRIRSLFLKIKSQSKEALSKSHSSLLSFSESFLKKMKNDVETSTPNEEIQFFARLRLAEASFLVSDLFHDLGDFARAETHTHLAIQMYTAIGANRKALRSKFNLVVTKAEISPDKSYLPEFFALLQQAKKIQDAVTIGNLYHSISHEYECIGALRNSLRAIDRAIALSFKYHFSSKVSDYLAHKVDLLVKLNEKNEARSTFELLKSVKSTVGDRAIQYLTQQHSFLTSHASQQSIQPDLPASYWLDKLQPSEQLGLLEERLLGLLAGQRKTRIELAEQLYGQSLPIQSTEARTKNLLFRIRKRFPDLIRFKNGYYEINRASELRA